ncbi:MAG: translation initiation factor IF-3 [Cyanophyceae cyanobacterium]
MRRSRRSKPRKPFRQPDKHCINKNIRADQVRVIDDSGQQVGVKPLQEALVLAREAELDLVEVAPEASPPVCKLIDYGKFKYRLQKREAEAKKKQTDNTVKELKVRYCTDSGDLNTKLKHARKFLANGCKVKFSMRFRGRERAFVNLGREKLEQIVQQLSDVANLDELSSQSKSQMHALLTPN